MSGNWPQITPKGLVLKTPYFGDFTCDLCLTHLLALVAATFRHVLHTYGDHGIVTVLVADFVARVPCHPDAS